MDLDELARTEGPRVLATLIRFLGDIDAAEEAVQEALITALERWPVDGVPERPGAWLTTTARNKALDRIRREARRDAKHLEAVRLLDDLGPPPAVDESGIVDDQLRLIFTCSHPAIPAEGRIALTLRTVGGLTTPEIARAFLVPEPTVAQRIVRAKKKITAAAIPYSVPPAHELPARLGSVLDVVETIFTEATYASAGEQLVRVDLAAEAVRLARLLAELMPDEPEVLGLLALLLATQARHGARLGEEAITLEHQDRSLWDHAAIAEADALVQESLRRNRLGPRQLRAALSCVHGRAPSWAETDWEDAVGLYDLLVQLVPGPVTTLNRAVAVSFLRGPAAALGDVRAVVDALPRWHLARAVLADLLTRLDERAEAREALLTALALGPSGPEQRLLRQRLEALQGD